MTEYNIENKNLFLGYLDRHFLNKSIKHKSSLELVITSICNTKCSYCYYKNYGENLYPASMCKDTDNILNNCKKIIDWDKNNGYRFSNIEIFSGEFFQFPKYKEILNYILENTPYHIVIPTNATFLFSEEQTLQIENLYGKYIGNRIFLSLSIDGKYLDNETRPMRNGKQYTYEFYDKLFAFAAKYNLSFHPMVGPKGISNWIKNYEWYISNVIKYFNISKKDAFQKIYLLEVRNPDWSKEEINTLQKFIEYLVDITYAEYNDPDDYFENFLKKRGFNFFSTFVSIIGRGLGCSIQQCFSVRMADLTLLPCHRTSYKGYNAGKLIFDNSKINHLDIEIENPELYMTINSFDAAHGFKCIDCFINELCAHPCLGCNFEVNKDPFIPVSTVCYMEYAKTKAIAKSFEKHGVLDKVINIWKYNSNQQSKANQLINIKEIVKNEV